MRNILPEPLKERDGGTRREENEERQIDRQRDRQADTRESRNAFMLAVKSNTPLFRKLLKYDLYHFGWTGSSSE